MQFRSTNHKFTHFQGDVLSNVDDGSSHGVQLTGGSTGGVVQSYGDEDNIALTVRGKGTGGITIGNSSQAVTLPFLASTGFASTHINLNSTKISIGGSTAYLTVVRRVRVDFTIPTMAINAGAEQGDIAVSGLTTNAVITMSPRGPLNSSVAGVLVQSYCSTAGQLHLTYQNAGTTITGSTMSAYAMIHDFNIPV